MPVTTRRRSKAASLQTLNSSINAVSLSLSLSLYYCILLRIFFLSFSFFFWFKFSIIQFLSSQKRFGLQYSWLRPCPVSAVQPNGQMVRSGRHMRRWLRHPIFFLRGKRRASIVWKLSYYKLCSTPWRQFRWKRERKWLFSANPRHQLEPIAAVSAPNILKKRGEDRNVDETTKNAKRKREWVDSSIRSRRA